MKKRKEKRKGRKVNKRIGTVEEGRGDHYPEVDRRCFT